MPLNTTRTPVTAYSISGEGPWVVLVHGLGLNQHMWQWQLPALESDFRVLRYDLLGHGDSEKPTGPYTMSMMVQQLAALLDDLDILQCALLGFSLGGLIGQAFALQHQDRLWALGILHAAHARSDEEREAILRRVEQSTEAGPAATVRAALERWFTPEFAESQPQVLEQVHDWVTAMDPTIYPHLYRLLASGDIGLERKIRAINCPTLVVTGEQDYGNSALMAQRMAELIPTARAEVLPGLRHMALAEDPAAMNTLLVDFLQQNLARTEVG